MWVIVKIDYYHECEDTCGCNVENFESVHGPYGTEQEAKDALKAHTRFPTGYIVVEITPLGQASGAQWEIPS